MKEAIGTSMVFNIILIFLGVFIALYVGSISYSKGFLKLPREKQFNLLAHEAMHCKQFMFTSYNLFSLLSTLFANIIKSISLYP